MRLVRLAGFRISCFLLATGLVSGGPIEKEPANSRQTPKVGFILDNRDPIGPKCLLWRPGDTTYDSKRYIFVSEYAGPARMNINGRDVELALVDSREPKGKLRRGQRSSFRYKARGIQVDVLYVVTGTCPPEQENCEVVYYDATITVIRGTGKRSVAAHGLCGS